MAEALPAPSTALSEQRERLRKRKAAFREVFGTATGRTIAQAIVMEHLEATCYMRRPIFVADQSGGVQSERAAFADGRRSVVLEINDLLAASDDLSEKKPKTKR